MKRSNSKEDQARLKKIGEGSISKVYKAEDKEYGEVAIKKFKYDMKDYINNEIELLKACQCSPYIVKYITSDEKSITMEKLDFTVTDLLRQRKHPVEKWVGKMILDILYAIDYLSLKEIDHCDLSPNNIMVKFYPSHPTQSLEPSMQFKLIDFSYGSFVSSQVFNVTRECYGAPELYRINDDIIDTSKTLVWSLGQVYFYCLTGNYLVLNLFRQSTFNNDQLERNSEEYFTEVRKFVQDEEFSQAKVDDSISEIKKIYPVQSTEQHAYKNFLYNSCKIDPNERLCAYSHLEILQDVLSS